MSTSAPSAVGDEAAVDRRSALRLALVVAVAHGFNDAYASFVPPLLPRLMGEMGLSITLAATLAVSYSVASALPQPFFGYLADRWGRRPLAVWGPVVGAIFVSTMGWAPNFVVLVAVLVVGGIGSAAFHPPGASYAVRVREGGGGGARYSIFSFGGSIGFALGPVLAVWLVQQRGLDGMWVAMVPMLLLAPLVYMALPAPDEDRRAGAAIHPPPRVADVVALLRGPLGLLFGISAVMAFVQRAFLTMEPIIVAAGGGSEARGALVLTVYLGAQSFGTVFGGLLADQVDRRRLLTHLCLWAIPTHLLAVMVGPAGWAGLSAAALAGFLGMATLPPLVVMAQEMLPSGAGVSSGIVMGLAWATGAMGVLATGALADVVGPSTATLASIPAALVGVALTMNSGLRPYARPTRHGGDGAGRGASLAAVTEE